MKALTPEEIRKVLKVASESRRNHAMILLAYRHGMRASEVCNLKLNDVDLKNGEITIRRLKGSLKTVQPLSDMPGQPLLSEKRVLRAWLAILRDDLENVGGRTSKKVGKSIVRPRDEGLAPAAVYVFNGLRSCHTSQAGMSR